MRDARGGRAPSMQAPNCPSRAASSRDPCLPRPRASRMCGGDRANARSADPQLLELAAWRLARAGHQSVASLSLVARSAPGQVGTIAEYAHDLGTDSLMPTAAR